MDCPKVPFSFPNPTKHSVVRSDKKLPGAFQYDASAQRPHSRIDNHDMNSARGKFLINGKQIESGGLDILWRNFVGDINDDGGGIDGEYRALHRANEIILRAEVSQESNDRGFQVSSFEFRVPSLKLGSQNTQTITALMP